MWLRVLKNFGILLAIVLSILYSVPNLFKQSPAIEMIATRDTNFSIDSAEQGKLKTMLQDIGVDVDKVELLSSESGSSKLVVVLPGYEEQMQSYQFMKEHYDSKAIISLSKISQAPSWLGSIGSKEVNLGLDLQGGVHFLMEVDLQKALQSNVEGLGTDVKRQLREEKIRFLRQLTQRNSELNRWEVLVMFRSMDEANKGIDFLTKTYQHFNWEIKEGNASGESLRIIGYPSAKYVSEFNQNAVEQNLVTLRNRINELGVSEPIVQQNGSNRIIVELPGVQDPAQAKKIIGATANLEFRLEASPGTPSFDRVAFKFRDNPHSSSMLERDVIISGDNVNDANASFDENGRPQVNISLDGTGGRLMADATKNAIGRRMAVVFKETKNRTIYTSEISGSGENSKIGKKTESYIISGIISLATIQSMLGSQFRITGVGKIQDANDLALLLRAGSLSAPMYFVEERTIGPSLGAKNVRQGFLSILSGIILVMLFMIAYYRLSGLMAVVAVSIHTLMIVSIMSLLGATLTLPGIAGIVLGMGMAVDANVLIFSRFREEKMLGHSFLKSLSAGHHRAFLTIFDSNLTTLVMAFILFFIGTGPVRGFAVTLTVGIMTSMFTSLTMTKRMIEWGYRPKYEKWWF